MRNVALLEATMQHIKDHPELHEQSSVFLQSECGTAACFAGWACMLSGFQPAWKSSYIGAEAMGVETDAGRTSAMEIVSAARSKGPARRRFCHEHGTT
ncbi:hypothetical protein MINTMi27_15000 [Mycobacterium intracellulare]|nr:hypothetical protein MINTMi27_15000 [Mycobacterium intracellulare]